MTRHHGGQCMPQCLDIKRAKQTQHAWNVIGRNDAIHAFKRPESALPERQHNLIFAKASHSWGQLWARVDADARQVRREFDSRRAFKYFFK